MNWRVKCSAFKVLEWLPRDVGDALYHWLQACSGSLDPRRALDENLRTFDLFTGLLTRTCRNIAGSDILELGSGWYPATPYLLLYGAGARMVNTYDIAEHFSPVRLRRFNAAFESRLSLWPKVNGQSPLALPREVRYFPRTNLVTSPPPDHSVDLVISRVVLEYIPPNDLLELHRVFRHCLRPGGAVLHFVSTCDDRANSDESLSFYDFLKYSEADWRGITTRFYYQNRLRWPQYLDLFKAAGFQVEHQTHKPLLPGSQEFSKFSRLRLHPDYARFTFEELTATELQFVLS
jgi:SAM-dependent methyltransferase